MKDWANILFAATLAALLALPGCGRDREAEDAAALAEAESDERPEAGAEAAGERAADAAAAAEGESGNPLLGGAEGGDDAAERIEIRDDTAEEAMQTWMDLLIAAEYERAADEICVAGEPGTQGLRDFAANMERIRNDPEAGGGYDLAVTVMSQDLASQTWTPVETSPDRALFLIEKGDPRAPNVEVEVVRTEEGWRVVPPETANGMP